ncbi:Plasmodium variant antigen protein Cir/Yir/Bir, putative [Plasmodium vivax]|uniref:Plasmodium variant antigen protein Cir/Yir/Bir, putative n=1 Tax=Plasmodium vivax TaxID=5855 RepID=A0A1G4E5R6_PLAVI|nr:Plasmodium variant antigen protein Cir/Yir/Bir, putative [Plasmodium vivax]
MTRCESPKEGMFKFFENIDRYINAVKSPENASTQQEVSRECTLMSNYFYRNKNPGVAKSICEQFLKLYISLNEYVSKIKTDPTYLSAVHFLNYWLNAELKKKLFKENIDVNDFYDNLETYAQSIDAISFLNIKEICVIKNDELDNMNILYNLYSNYYNVFNGSNIVCATKESCLEYSKQCFQEYKKGIIKCENNDSDFCKAIKEFENKYDSLKRGNKTNNGFNSKELMPLPSYEQAFEEYQSELNRRITIFTPFGKWLPINKKNQEKRHAMKEKMYNFIDNSNEYSTYNEYTPYRFGYNST